jgi:hypothetical protein
MGIKLKNNNNNLDLTTKIQQIVIDGGVYTPQVDEEGNLSWIPSREGLPPVETVNIKGMPGDKGEDGDSGVYVGATEPTDKDILVWINPDGEASEALATKEYVDEAVKNASGASVDLTNYYTKTEVDNKIPDVSKFQTEEQVNALINSALEEVENGTY